MLRGELIKSDGLGLDHDPNFRWRGQAVTRIENLSDIAFALSLSMLVAGSGTPQTFQDLGRFLFSILPVAAGFSVLLGIWHGHFTFFRRYGVANNRIIFINAALIFVVLYMAYPLRFAFDSLFAFVIMQFGNNQMMYELGIMDFDTSGVIITYFATAYAVAHFLLALMHSHALKNKTLLSLTNYEITITKREIFIRYGLALLAAAVALIAYFTILNGMAAGFLFFTFLPYALAKKFYPDEVKA